MNIMSKKLSSTAKSSFDIELVESKPSDLKSQLKNATETVAILNRSVAQFKATGRPSPKIAVLTKDLIEANDQLITLLKLSIEAAKAEILKSQEANNEIARIKAETAEIRSEILKKNEKISQLDAEIKFRKAEAAAVDSSARRLLETLGYQGV